MAPGIPATMQELIDFARPRLTFRVPKHVAFVDAIPKNPYGKVDRSKVSEAIGAPAEVPQ
jgi:acyl-coenzyme A synthetase/AMP-(fatty) acid ligase